MWDMKDTKHTFIPNNLRRCRKVRGLSQKRVAHIMELKSTAMISRWEAGRCIPNTANLFDLAAVYRSTSEALYSDYVQERRHRITAREERSGGNAMYEDD
jgi:transcriptional regulator with XRE-family HTH domain